MKTCWNCHKDSERITSQTTGNEYCAICGACTNNPVEPPIDQWMEEVANGTISLH